MQIFWKIWIQIFLPHPFEARELKVYKNFKLALEPELQIMISYKHKDKKNPKDEPRITKNEQFTDIFVSQLKVKSQFLKIFK